MDPYSIYRNFRSVDFFPYSELGYGSSKVNGPYKEKHEISCFLGLSGGLELRGTTKRKKEKKELF